MTFPLEPSPKKAPPSKGVKIVAAAITGLVALCCIGGVAVFVTNMGKSSSPPADRSLEGTAMCETFVKRQLKAPATAKFSEEKTSKVGAAEYTTSGAVDSQNSFGALLRATFQCDLTVGTDNTWTSKSVTVTPG